MSWCEVVFVVWSHVLHVWQLYSWDMWLVVMMCWGCAGESHAGLCVGTDAAKPLGVVSLYGGNIIVFPYPTPLLGLHQVQILPCRSKQAAAAWTITVSVLDVTVWSTFV